MCHGCSIQPAGNDGNFVSSCYAWAAKLCHLCPYKSTLLTMAMSQPVPTLCSCAQHIPLIQRVHPGDALASAFYLIISYPTPLYYHTPYHPLPWFARCGRSTAALCICMRPLPLCLVVLAGVRSAVQILPGVDDSLRVGVGFGVEAIVAIATDERLTD